MNHKSRWLAWLLIVTFILTIIPVLPAQAATPTITGITPAAVPAETGGDIRITGTNLGDLGTQVILGIGNETIIIEGSAIKSRTANLLVVTVPAHEVGEDGVMQVDDLTVVHNTGASTPYSNPFKWVAKPSISHSYPFTVVSTYDTSGNPSQSTAAKKTYLKIEGSYWRTVTKVYLRKASTTSGYDYAFGSFTGAQGAVNFDTTDPGVYVDITNLMVGETVYARVENSSGYASTWQQSIYYNEPVPYVTTFYPNPNPIYTGLDLNISGANFLNTSASNTKVYVAGTQANITNLNDSNIALVVPNPQQGSTDLKIEVYESGKKRGVAIYRNAVTVKIMPEGIKVEQVLPNHGPVLGGNTVIVVGEKFDQTMTVAFEIAGHTTLATSCTTITPPSYLPEGKTAFQVVVPAAYGGSQGAVTVKIVDRTNTAAVFAKVPNLYFYSTAGQYLDLQAIVPDKAAYDMATPIQLQGQYFSYFRKSGSASNKYVVINDVETPISDVDNISLTTGVNELKLVEVIPSYYNGQDFKIVRTIVVTVGGTTAAINGISTIDNMQYLTAETGFYPLGSKASEKVNVDANVGEVTYYKNGANWESCVDQTYYPLQETDTLTSAFTYNRIYPSPEILSIVPASGANMRTTEVVITGYNFYEGLTITFGGKSAGIVSLKQGAFVTGKGPLMTLTVTAPTSATRGQVPVVITNADGRSISTIFTYVSSPDINQVTPKVGPVTGGNLISIYGEQFMHGAAVVIGNTMVCRDTASQTAMTALMADETFKQVVFGSETTIDIVVDEGLRVIGTDGVEISAYSTNPDGVRIILPVPESLTAGSKNVFIINPDRGWVMLENGYQYKVITGSSVNLTIQPGEGTADGGEEVVITSTGGSFLPDIYTENNGYGVIVTIDGTVATIKSITNANQRIAIMTPPGTRLEEEVPVQVLNVSPEGIRMDEKEDGFIYHRILTLPVITEFMPLHGQSGTVVSVFGHDFAVDDETKVIFGDQELTQAANGVQVIDSGAITFPVPTDALGQPLSPGSYTIKVRNPDTGTAVASKKFTLQIPASKPAIQDTDGDGKAITPNQGSTNGGTDIVLEGYDFYLGLELYIDGRPATSVQLQLMEFDEATGVWTKCIVRAKTPALTSGRTPGAVDVMLVNPDGGTATLNDGFTYVVPSSQPVITAVSPNKGPSSGNQEVTITGSDFRVVRDASNQITGWPKVTFGGYEATVVQDATIARTQGKQIKILTPAHIGGGQVDVSLINPDYGVCSLGKAYTYEVSKPTITNILPNNIANKKSPTYKVINGTNFLPLQNFQGATQRTRVYLQYPNGAAEPTKTIEIVDGTTAIRINDTETQSISNIEIVSPTEMRLVLPALADTDKIGSWALHIVNPDGGYADKEIIYVSVDTVDMPSVTLPLIPNIGSLKGGTIVTVNGKNFQDGVAVYFDGAKMGSVTRSSDGKKLTFETPSGKDPEDIDRAIDLAIVNPDGGQCFLSDVFTYRQAESDPTVTSISPSIGPTKGGTVVTILGTNFKTGVRIYFNTVEIDSANVTRVDANTIKVITPVHDLGAVDVIIRNTDYGEAKAKAGFTYVGSPEPEVGTFVAEVIGKSYIRLRWPAITGVVNYEITASIGDNSHWAFLGSTTSTEFILRKVKPDTSYYFRLRTVNSDGFSTSIDATPFPLKVSADDIEDLPPTGKIEEFADEIKYASGKLVIIVGKDVVFDTGMTYTISLTETQRKATGMQVLIPVYAIDNASHKTVVISTDRYKLTIPLKALITFEYKNKKLSDADTFVSLNLNPGSPAVLESASLNTKQRAIGSFTLSAVLKQPHQQDVLTFFSSDLNVNSQVPQAFGAIKVCYMDPATRKWVVAPASKVLNSDMYSVNIKRPQTIVFFVPTTMR
ncbi:MAG: IPT/TIG domain-containing protein [Ignavibacteriales bacterium]